MEFSMEDFVWHFSQDYPWADKQHPEHDEKVKLVQALYTEICGCIIAVLHNDEDIKKFVRLEYNLHTLLFVQAFITQFGMKLALNGYDTKAKKNIYRVMWA